MRLNGALSATVELDRPHSDYERFLLPTDPSLNRSPEEFVVELASNVRGGHEQCFGEVANRPHLMDAK